MRVRIVRHDHHRELRNGHVSYAQMAVRLDSTFGRPVARPRHPYRAPRPWRARLMDLGIGLVCVLVGFGLLWVLLAIGRALEAHQYLGGS